VLNLSSWAEKRQPLPEWLIEELNRNFGVSRKLAVTWLADNKVLPLLDGLDELKAERRAACVRAINVFRRQHGLLPLVICCRTADYDALPTMLKDVGGSVIVRPLSRAQILWYPDELGASGAQNPGGNS
jgi:predicted NACHT family NTPase